MALREKYLFNQYPRFEDFKKMLDQVLAYSKSSGVYSYVDKDGITRILFSDELGGLLLT